MFEKCNWTKYLIIPKHNYQRNITCVALLNFFSSCNRLFHERRAIARIRAHAHLEMSRRAKNCLPNKQQITQLECFYFLQA